MLECGFGFSVILMLRLQFKFKLKHNSDSFLFFRSKWLAIISGAMSGNSMCSTPLARLGRVLESNPFCGLIQKETAHGSRFIQAYEYEGL